MILIYCNKCQSEMFTPGGIILTPPDSEGNVRKIHICVNCWGMLAMTMGLPYV